MLTVCAGLAKSQENWVIMPHHKNVNKTTWATGQGCEIHSQPRLLEIRNSSRTNIWRMIQAIRALWFLVSPQQLLYYMRCEVHGQQDCCFCYTVSITHSKLQLHGPFSLELTLTGTFLGSQACYLHYRGQFWLWWPRNYQGGVCSIESHWMSLSMKVNVWAWKWQFEKLFFSRAFNLENQGSHSHPTILTLIYDPVYDPLLSHVLSRDDKWASSLRWWWPWDVIESTRKSWEMDLDIYLFVFKETSLKLLG